MSHRSHPSSADDGPARQLLAPSDPDPVAIDRPQGQSDILLIGDHAGNAVPASLGDLGVDPEDRNRHIAIDIGTRALGQALSERLNATFVHQRYSRLVIDCNRSPHQDSAMPTVSDGTPVPANARLTEPGRQARVAAIFAPYQDAIARTIAERLSAGRAVVLVSLHSFTPRLLTSPDPATRPWHVGVLHDRGDTALSHAMLAVLREDETLIVGDNEPYKMDGTDHTVPRHAYPDRLPYLELEVRQDLIGHPDGVMRWADKLADAIPRAVAMTAR